MSAGTRTSRGRPLQAQPRRRALRLLAGRRWVRWVVVGLVTIAVVLAAGYTWLRDSSLVSVRKVQVSGVSGPDARQIRSALIMAARNMTTLDVNIGQLRTAVEPYPDVKSIEVSTQFPHAMRIRVVEQVPVAVVIEAGRRVEVAGDGTLLHDASPAASLPTISLTVPPGGRRLTGYPAERGSTARRGSVSAPGSDRRRQRWSGARAGGTVAQRPEHLLRRSQPARRQVDRRDRRARQLRVGERRLHRCDGPQPPGRGRRL